MECLCFAAHLLTATRGNSPQGCSADVCPPRCKRCSVSVRRPASFPSAAELTEKAPAVAGQGARNLTASSLPPQNSLATATVRLDAGGGRHRHLPLFKRIGKQYRRNVPARSAQGGDTCRLLSFVRATTRSSFPDRSTKRN